MESREEGLDLGCPQTLPFGRPVGEETSGDRAQPEPWEPDAALVDEGAKEENEKHPPQPRKGVLGGPLLSPRADGRDSSQGPWKKNPRVKGRHE